MRPLTPLAFALALASIGPVSAHAQESYRHGHVRYVDPGVSIQRASESGAEEALVNTPFLPGDRVWTDAGGRVEFQFPEGTTVRIDVRSKLDYSGHEEGRSERIVLRLWSGSLMVRGRERSATQFEVETPGGTVAPRERSLVRVDVDAGEARVSVYEGEATLDDGRSRVRLAESERTYTRYGDSAAEPERFDRNEQDAFLQWDQDRESDTRWASNSGYLPQELEDYAGDLDGYGDWRYESNAGYVWVPQVDAGWQPYSNGNWTWTAYGWTWIPNERWGWAPFHYGNWDYSASLGWYWFPGRTWSPAWVNWAVGDGYVGWCATGRHGRPVVAWGHRGGNDGYGRERGHAVPRGRHGNGPGEAWNVVRQGELGRRSLAGVRVPTGRIDPGMLRVSATPRERLTRDGGRLVEGEAVPRAISRRQTPGDFVRELSVDNKTSIPAPWTRGYGPPPAGVDGARYGAQPRERERESSGRGGGAATTGGATSRQGNGSPTVHGGGVSAGGEGGEGAAQPRGGRPVPWFRPSEGGESSGNGTPVRRGGEPANRGEGRENEGQAAPRPGAAERRAPNPWSGTVAPRGGESGSPPPSSEGAARPRGAARPFWQGAESSAPAAAEPRSPESRSVPFWRGTRGDAGESTREPRPAPVWGGVSRGEQRPQSEEAQPREPRIYGGGPSRRDAGEPRPAPVWGGVSRGEQRSGGEQGAVARARGDGGGSSSGARSGGGGGSEARSSGGVGAARSSDGGGHSAARARPRRD